MPDIDEVPRTAPSAVIRRAGRTHHAGNLILKQLIEAGKIDPQKDPNGYSKLRWPEVRVFWDALHGQA